MLFFSARVSLWKRVRKMPKSGTGHADWIGFRGHIYVMHRNNSSLPLGNKMTGLSNIDSYHETLTHIAYHGCACSICAQIIQRILWCYNWFCVISIGIAYNGFCVPWVQSDCQLGISGMTYYKLVTDLVRSREGEILLTKIFVKILMFLFWSSSVIKNHRIRCNAPTESCVAI